MGNSPSTPGQTDNNSNANATAGESPGKGKHKQSQQTASISGTGIGGTNMNSGPGRGAHSNIPIQPSLAAGGQQQRPTTQFRPPLPPAPAQPRPLQQFHQQQQQQQPQQQHRPVSQYIPKPYIPQKNQTQSRSPQPNHQSGLPRVTAQQTPSPFWPTATASSSSPSTTAAAAPSTTAAAAPSTTTAAAVADAAEDEIPTIVLQEQMEAILIAIATTEPRVRELREELDTFESHPIFSSMMLAWFLSFNPGDYSIHRLEDLKKDALKAWEPVLAAFLQDSHNGSDQGQNLTEIEVRLFESIIQDVISHANMIAGSTLAPEQLIQNLIQVAHSELDKARRTLEENRNAFQECQLTLQARGVIPTTVLEIQRQIEADQQKEQEAKRAKEQRQKEIVAQKRREYERKKELEEKERREREEKERREREQKEQREREQKELRLKEERRLQELENQKKQEALRKKQEELRQQRDIKPVRPVSAVMSSAHHASNHPPGRPSTAPSSVPSSLPPYSAHFAKRVHAESPEAFAVSFSEQETVLTDQDPQDAHDSHNSARFDHEQDHPRTIPGSYPIKSMIDAEEEVDPATPLLRRQRILPNLPEEPADITASSMPNESTTTHYGPYSPAHTPNLAPAILLPTQMPIPYIPERDRKEYGLNRSHSYVAGKTPELPRVMPEPRPLYPPQIITEQDLQSHLMRERLEQLEQLKKENEEMEREIIQTQEQQRLQALALQNIEMQPAVVSQGYGPYSHMSQDEYHGHGQQMQNHFPGHQLYPPYTQRHNVQQQQQQQSLQGYPVYHTEYGHEPSASAYVGPMTSGSDSTMNHGEQYNYQQYGGYSNHTMAANASNWGPQQQQQHAGYMHNQYQQHQQHQQQYQYSTPLLPAHQQQLYHQQQQQQQQQQQFQQQLSPGHQSHNGYVDPRIQGMQANVTYSISPHSSEYDFTTIVSEAPAIVAASEGAVSTEGPLQENDARSPEVLPQIRANPVKTPVRRGPQAILSEEQQEAAARALKAMDQDPEEDEVHETEVEKQCTSKKVSLHIIESAVDATQHQQQSQNEEPNVETESPVDAEHDSGTEPSPVRPTKPSSDPIEDKVRVQVEEEEEEEEEEEVLQRTVRRMHIVPALTPASRPESGSSPSSKKSLVPLPTITSPSETRARQVFAPFPNQRPPPRAAPRPAPRPISTLMTKPSLEPLSVRKRCSSVSKPDIGSNTPPEPESPVQLTTTSKPKGSQPDAKQRGALHRAPSLPPAVPKKPLALRSPLSPSSTDKQVV
ncbi:hypothetical protein BGZ51_007254 [Haplosporangium sp. Z 767]|nr:hypothetical protein BGZ50_007305 [Haplosporangium sp. Z 11]KAF9179087.1 hypothetical protein BGZ51_007254 [Haplosporangium sp. Z 767]